MELLIKGEREGVWFHGKLKLYTTSKCAELFGFHTPAASQSADKKMRRAGFVPFTRQTGRTGQNLWKAEDVRSLLN